MTAKWGKSSIGCFILGVVVAAVLAVVIANSQGYKTSCPMVKNSPFLFMSAVLLASPANLLGTVLAFVGMRKKETPNFFYRLGIVLNLPLTIYSALLLYACLFTS
ncbi:MAG: hypothetical protein FWF96_05905 [Kiritimatiellaeota bacterium]|nr:hypothetical protein [Kiritimatiellota bacterium]